MRNPFAANGTPRAGLKKDEGDGNRKLRHGLFFLALFILLFRREGSSVQQEASKRPYSTSVKRPAPAPAPTAPRPAPLVVNSNAVTASTATDGVSRPADRFDTNVTTDGSLLLSSLSTNMSNVLAESHREEMTIRYSNETWVTQWRTKQAAKREEKPIRNIDWSKVDCIDSEEWEKCDLTDDRWGVSVVLLSFGRSGSSNTWETMTSLASERGQPAREDIGGNSESAFKELNAIKPEEHGKCWLERILCRHQYNNKVAMKEGLGKSEIIGTKWKPFLKAFNHPKSREALEWLASSPHIKLVHNERNFLDVAISRYKHMNTNAPAHCYGQQCIEYHKQEMANTTVPVGFIKDTLHQLEKQANGIAAILEELKVPHLKVIYERLYYARRADQWMDIFRFVGVGPMSGLTMDHIRAHMTQFSTHADDRSEAIGNFDQIRKALRNTEYKDYLRPVVRKSTTAADRGEVVLD